MISGRRAEAWISADPRGGKHELPPPVSGGVDVLAPDGKREHNPPESTSQIVVVLLLDAFQVGCEERPGRPRQHGHTILPSLALPNGEFRPIEIKILHT